MGTAAAETTLLSWLALLGWSVEISGGDDGDGYLGIARHHGDDGDLEARVTARSLDDLSVDLFCAALARLEESRWSASLLVA